MIIWGCNLSDDWSSGTVWRHYISPIALVNLLNSQNGIFNLDVYYAFQNRDCLRAISDLSYDQLIVEDKQNVINPVWYLWLIVFPLIIFSSVSLKMMA